MDFLALPESSVVTVLIGIGILVAGYLIKFRGWTFLLAGYDPNAVTDEEALADLAGETILHIGLAVIAFGGAVAAELTRPVVEGIFAVAILIAAGRLIYRARAYTA